MLIGCRYIHQSLQIISLPPYNFVYLTFAKQRWLNKKYLDVLSIEFMDYSHEYFHNALRIGQVQILRKDHFIFDPDLTAKDSDIVLHFTHRHEAPIFGLPKIIDSGIIINPPHLLNNNQNNDYNNPNANQNENNEINALFNLHLCLKPAGVPVHPSSHYNKHSLTELINFQAANRLDRLVSGYLLGSDQKQELKVISKLQESKQIHKIYVAHTHSNPVPESIQHSFALVFAPVVEQCQTEDEAVRRTADISQISSLYPELYSQKVFQSSAFDATTQLGCVYFNNLTPNNLTDLREFIQYLLSKSENIQGGRVQTAVSLYYFVDSYALCAPVTGRTHQLRMHLQYCGCPIIDDPLYGGELQVIRQEIVRTCSSKQEGKIDNQELRALAIESLKKLKALRHKDVDELCQSLSVPINLVCLQCEMIQKQDDGEDLLKVENGVVKIQNPWNYTQKYIQLHNFYYSIQGQEFVGEMPEWAQIDMTEQIGQFRRFLLELMKI